GRTPARGDHPRAGAAARTTGARRARRRARSGRAPRVAARDRPARGRVRHQRAVLHAYRVRPRARRLARGLHAPGPAAAAQRARQPEGAPPAPARAAVRRRPAGGPGAGRSRTPPAPLRRPRRGDRARGRRGLARARPRTRRAARSAVAGGPVRGGGRMNTSASDAMVPGRSRPQPFQRTLAMLRACGPRPAVRVLCALAMALLVAGAMLVTVYAASPGSGAIGTVTLVSFAVAAPWALWCSRLLLLRMEAQAWRMTALLPAIPVALLHMMLATVSVPAVLLVLLAGALPLFTVSC